MTSNRNSYLPLVNVLSHYTQTPSIQVYLKGLTEQHD